jgi:para-aminobenzoate synthetase/4-amino-4-deoxychorismate lyase
MINEAILFNQFNNEWVKFENPVQIYRTHSLDEVIPILQSIDDHIKDNVYLAGFISYEAAPAFDPALKTKDPTAFPLCWFGLYNRMSSINLSDIKRKNFESGKWISSVDRDDYYRNIQKIKNYLAEGYTYQVNYTYRLSTKFSGDPLSFFVDLVDRQMTYNAAFLDMGDSVICSASPELFFKLEGNSILSKPMKGTKARGKFDSEDLENINNLHRSVKDRAENTMIVDMTRNDLGRISEAGSVKVESLYDIEKYQTILQMTSSVKAKTSASLSIILKSLFPAASVTGAPKYKTTEIIANIESTPRKIYTGCIGFVMPGRRAQFNVAIRTVLIDRKLSQAEYGVGGGIVWDSDAKEEYEESHSKMKVLTEIFPQFDLLETMLWTPSKGFFLLDYHLKRLKNSAEYFGFSFNKDLIRKKLDEISSKYLDNSYKTRLILEKNGQIIITSDIIEKKQTESPVKLSISKTHVNSTDPLLYHKTTNRQLYERAKNQHNDSDDVILINERNEITETSIFNIVIKQNEKYFTPDLSCGLLPGTFRAWLLDQNKMHEKIIHVNDLKKCDEIFVINSVRQWQKAVLI